MDIGSIIVQNLETILTQTSLIGAQGHFNNVGRSIQLEDW